MRKKEVRRKGQAAVEYLITYGWTILIILITIGLIIYFDVLNPNKFLPSQCEFGEQIKCQDMFINQNGQFKLKFVNNFPKAINITDVVAIDYPNAASCPSPGGHIVSINSSRSGEFTCTINGVLFPVGEKQQVRLKILFQRSYSSTGAIPPLHEVRGVFVTTIEK